MNLRFLKEINKQLLREDHEKRMSSEEMQSYLKLLYKKCNKKTQEEFNEYLEKECGVEGANLEKCSDVLCKDEDRCDKVIHYLENLSEKLDENSLMFIMKESFIDADKMKGATRLGLKSGVAFYEHPTQGDESPLVANVGNKFYITDFWELSDIEPEDALKLKDKLSK